MSSGACRRTIAADVRAATARERCSARRRAGSPGRRSTSVDAVAARHDRRLDEVHRRRADEAGDEQVRAARRRAAAACRSAAARRAHHGDAVAHRHRLDLVVRDVDRRRLEVALELARSPRASGRAASRRGSRAARPSGTPAARARSRGPSRRAGAGRRRAPSACGEVRREVEQLRRPGCTRSSITAASARLRIRSPKAMFSATVMCG